jgi:hypothetical protein
MKEQTPECNLKGQGPDPFCSEQVVEIGVCQMGWKPVQCLCSKQVGPMDMGVCMGRDAFVQQMWWIVAWLGTTGPRMLVWGPRVKSEL